MFNIINHCCYCSVAKSCLILCNPMDCNTPNFLVLQVSWSFLKFMSIESVMPFNHLLLCQSLLLVPSIFPSIRVLFNESALTSGGQSIRTSASTSVLLMNIQGWFPLGLTGLVSLQSKGLSRVFSSTISH